MLNIRRVDHEASRTHCWRVTVQRRSRLYRRDFSDRIHGGSEQALKAAQLYRDTLTQTHPPLGRLRRLRLMNMPVSVTLAMLPLVDPLAGR